MKNKNFSIAVFYDNEDEDFFIEAELDYDSLIRFLSRHISSESWRMMISEYHGLDVIAKKQYDFFKSDGDSLESIKNSLNPVRI